MLTFAMIILYCLKQFLIGIAAGVFFIRYKVFERLSNLTCMLVGQAVSHIFSGTLNYLLGLIFIGAKNWLWIIIPCIISVIWLVIYDNYKLAIDSFKELVALLQNIREKKTGIIFGACLACCLGLIFLSIFTEPHNYRYENDYVIKKISKAVSRAQSFFSGGDLKLNFLYYLVIMIMIIVIAVMLRTLVKTYYNDNSRLVADLFTGLAFTAIVLTILLGMNLNDRPMFDSDRSHYELEARFFSQDTDSKEIDNYKGSKEGSFIKDDHSPIYITSLADAYIIAPFVPNGNNQRLVNFMYFHMYFGFIVLFFVLARTVGSSRRVGLLSVILFSYYEKQNGMLTGNRDAFRFIGLWLLVLFIYNNSEKMACDEVNIKTFLITMILSYMAISAHTSNVFVVFGLYIALISALIVMRTRLKNIVLYGLAAVVGSSIGCLKTLSIYISTGRMDTTSSEVFFGTQILNQVRYDRAERYNWAGILDSYSIRIRVILFIGILSLVIMIIRGHKRHNRSLLVWAIMELGMLLPITGLFDLLWRNCQLYFIYQGRYRMYFLILLSISAAVLIVDITSKANITAVSIGIISGIFAVYVFSEYLAFVNYSFWGMRNDNVNACIKMCNEVGENTKGDIFTYRQEILFYTPGNPRLLNSTYSAPLIQAKNRIDIETGIKTLNIGAIMIPASGKYVFDYSLLPFWDYINKEFILIEYHDPLIGEEVNVYYNPSMYLNAN